MRSQGYHPADAEISREESVGISAAAGFGGRGTEAAHHVQAPAHFPLDEGGPAEMIVIEREFDIVRLRRERTGTHRSVLVAIEEFELRSTMKTI